MLECHFYPFFEKKMTCGIVSSGIQSMVNDAFLFCVFVFNDDAFCLMMMRFILIYLKLYLFKALFYYPHSHHFQSFLSISFKLSNFFQIPKYLSKL